MTLAVQPDPRVQFPASFVRGTRSKGARRRFAAQHALLWIRLQHRNGRRHGAIMFDIDDTLIDGHDCVANGFEFMRLLYEEVSRMYPIHVVTARPNDQHRHTMALLHARGFPIPPDRLHLLPAHLWGKDTRYVEQFKWQVFQTIGDAHRGVVARFGDKLWDVAHVESLRTYLAHVDDKDCYIFLDPRLRDTLSVKLPGAGD